MGRAQNPAAHVQDHMQPESFSKAATRGRAHMIGASAHHFNLSSGHVGSPSLGRCQKQPKVDAVLMICCPACRTRAIFAMIRCPLGGKWPEKQAGQARNFSKISSIQPGKLSKLLEVKVHWFHGAPDKANEAVRNTVKSEIMESVLSVRNCTSCH